MSVIDPRVYIREQELDGVDRWYWITGDTGTWQGPSEEWIPLKEKLLSLATQRRTIITGGGAQGMYPKLWAKQVERVFTFEPTPLSFYVLSLNCPENNIYKFNAALGDSHAMLNLNVDCEQNYGMNRIVDSPQEKSTPIAVLRIDDFELNDLDILQLDIEGWEHHALQGGAETIQRCHPVIALETVGSATEALLTGWGYSHRGKGGYDQVFAWS